MQERKQELGNYGYAADMRAHSDDGSLDLLSLEYLVDTGACVLGHARPVRRRVQALRSRGRRPAPVPGQPVQDRARQVMQTIDLMGKHVIPQFPRTSNMCWLRG
jgi:hypothetical protein